MIILLLQVVGVVAELSRAANGVALGAAVPVDIEQEPALLLLPERRLL